MIYLKKKDKNVIKDKNYNFAYKILTNNIQINLFFFSFNDKEDLKQ